MSKRTVLICWFFILVLLILILVLFLVTGSLNSDDQEAVEVEKPVPKIEPIVNTPTDIVETEEVEETAEEETTPTDVIETSPTDVATPTDIVEVEIETTPTDTTETDIQIEVEEPEPEPVVEPIVEEILEPEPEPEPVAEPVVEEIPEPEPPKKKEPRYDLYVSLSPYGLQYVDYEDYTSRNSEYGFGINVGSIFNFTKRFSCGLSFAYEQYSFKDFHKFNDLKAKITSKLKSLYISDRFEASLIFDLGADFVLRDDSDFGGYPLAGLGLELQYRFSEKLAVLIDNQCQLTLQKGSFVYHFVPHLGLVYKGSYYAVQ